jgi:hypothetical protein
MMNILQRGIGSSSDLLRVTQLAVAELSFLTQVWSVSEKRCVPGGMYPVEIYWQSNPVKHLFCQSHLIRMLTNA